MNDIYLYEDVPVLKNKFGIKDEKTLDLVEAEQSRASMMLLYEHGFHDFSNRGVKKIHRTLFEDVYEWAGNYRVINIIKREPVLAGQSVWYSNAEDIPHDLKCAWDEIHQVEWISLSKEDFAKEIAHKFPKIWRVHPFREGNTRTVVMLMTFFVEHYGYYFDQELLAQSAEYVRDALVMACLDNYSEYEYLERILQDAICTEPIVIASEDNIEDEENYKTFKEKVVERTVKLDMEYRRIQQEMIEDYKTETSEYKEFLKKESPKLFQVFEESGSRNLRTFKSCLIDFERVYGLWHSLKLPTDGMGEAL